MLNLRGGASLETSDPVPQDANAALAAAQQAPPENDGSRYTQPIQFDYGLTQDQDVGQSSGDDNSMITQAQPPSEGQAAAEAEGQEHGNDANGTNDDQIMGGTDNVNRGIGTPAVTPIGRTPNPYNTGNPFTSAGDILHHGTLQRVHHKLLLFAEKLFVTPC